MWGLTSLPLDLLQDVLVRHFDDSSIAALLCTSRHTNAVIKALPLHADFVWARQALLLPQPFNAAVWSVMCDSVRPETGWASLLETEPQRSFYCDVMLDRDGFSPLALLLRESPPQRDALVKALVASSPALVYVHDRAGLFPWQVAGPSLAYVLKWRLRLAVPRLGELEARLHKLMLSESDGFYSRRNAGSLLEENSMTRDLLQLAPLMAGVCERTFYPVPGMYGGYGVTLVSPAQLVERLESRVTTDVQRDDLAAMNHDVPAVLLVDSMVRVWGGSELYHGIFFAKDDSVRCISVSQEWD